MLNVKRILLWLLNYQHKIVHIPGKDMLLADASSRACFKDEAPEDVLDSAHSTSQTTVLPDDYCEGRMA